MLCICTNSRDCLSNYVGSLLPALFCCLVRVKLPLKLGAFLQSYVPLVVLSFLALMISNSALEINIPSLFEQLNIAFDDVTTGQKLNKVYHRLAVELIRKDGTSKAFSYPIKVCSASCSGLDW